MNITKSFVDFLEDAGIGTFGTDIYIGGVPLDAPDACYWVIANGGTLESKNTTGELQKNYTISVFYRDKDTEQLYDKMQELEETIYGCITLDNYNNIDISVLSYPTDQDLDDEERQIGVIDVSITIYN